MTANVVTYEAFEREVLKSKGADKGPITPENYGVRGLPTLILFRGREYAARHLGALTQKRKLKDWIEQAAGQIEVARAPRGAHFKLSNSMDVVAVSDPAYKSQDNAPLAKVV